MKRGRFLPWIIGLLPIALMAMCCAEPRLLPVINGDTLEQRILPVLVAAALIGVALAYWTAAVLRRYREQIALREQALREFNASVDEKVAEALDKQRRRDKVAIQHAKMRAMSEMAQMIEAQCLPETMPDDTDADEARQTMQAWRDTLRSLIEMVRPDMAREPVDLSESIKQVLGLLKAELAGIDVRTELECSMTLPLRRNEILQVLIGVIKNAKDALASSAGQSPRIDIECYETGQFVVIRICDNAGGVDANSTERIFEPYFTTKSHAAGLDLYLARSLIEEHCNGELTFDMLEEGSCFYIKIGKHQEEEAS